MTGALVVVGTPIGNLGDLSPRARDALTTADAVCCEDSRRAGRLLAAVGIERRSPFLVVNDHSEARMTAAVVERVAQGQRVALISDAGMPGLSDPGAGLVRSCLDAGLAVEVVPGPTAAVAALVTSGVAAGRFCFEGFLPRSGRARTERLAAVAGESRATVFYEAPHRLARTLADLAEVCGGDRGVVIRREITKLHDETWRGTLAEAVVRAGEVEPRGEHVLVLEGAPAVGPVADDDAVRAAMAAALAGGATLRDAAGTVAEALGVGRNHAYRLGLEARQ